MAEGIDDAARVEQRMGAIGAVGQVMRAVWALARAQQPQVEAAAAESAAYLDAAEAMVAQLAGDPIAEPDHDDVLWVLIGPERPFCGPLARVLLEQIPAEGTVGLVGSRLSEVAKQEPALLERVAFQIPAATTADDLGTRADALAAAILEHPHPTVVVLSPAVDGTELRGSTLLAGEREAVELVPETFLPHDRVLAAAVIEAVAGRLAVALADALRAEVRARMVAAEAARNACDRQLDDLQHHLRTLRQEAITQELIELTSGRR